MYLAYATKSDSGKERTPPAPWCLRKEIDDRLRVFGYIKTPVVLRRPHMDTRCFISVSGGNFWSLIEEQFIARFLCCTIPTILMVSNVIITRLCTYQ